MHGQLTKEKTWNNERNKGNPYKNHPFVIEPQVLLVVLV
jgi:hypothetical protein